MLLLSTACTAQRRAAPPRVAPRPTSPQSPPGAPTATLPAISRLVAGYLFDVSPDGKQILFGWHESTLYPPKTTMRDLYVADISGANQHPLVQMEWQSVASARYSPDGRYIAFLTGETAAGDLYVVPASGANPAQVTEAGHHGGNAYAWSPDSASIAYFDPAYGLVTITRDGTGRRELWTAKSIERIEWAEPTGALQPQPPLGAPVTTTPPSALGHIFALALQPDDVFHVIAVNPDGSGQIDLGAASNFSVGAQYVAVAKQGANAGLFWSQVVTGAQMARLDTGSVYYPASTADGLMVAYAKETGAGGSLNRNLFIATNKGDVRQQSTGVAPKDIRWTRDGAAILFTGLNPALTPTHPDFAYVYLIRPQS
jgi:dipeptidyl aminopeptidase/acylaminoacyl peptidase